MTPQEGNKARDAMVLLYDMINRGLDARAKTIGLSRIQAMAMDRIGHKPGMTQTELAWTLSTTKQYMSQMILRLQELRLVETKTPMLDARKQTLYLSAEGETLLSAWERVNERNLGTAMQCLSPEEREMLMGAFGSLGEVIPKLAENGATLL